MKRIFLLLAFILSCLSASAQYSLPFVEYIPVSPRPTVSAEVRRAVPDGNYQAYVKYHNQSTGYKENYVLVVTVKAGCVDEIHFSNGGYLHRSSNEYWYRDGGLRLGYDDDDDLVAYTTVTVSNNKLGQR